MIRLIRFAGSPREIGLERARRLDRLPLPDVDDGDLRFAEACRDAACTLNPDLDELYQGFRDGGGWQERRFLFYFFARRQGLLRGCTNFAVCPASTADGETLVGRNYDWAYSDLPYCEARAVDTEGRLAFVSYTHHWVGHPDCLNEAGLFVAISSLPAEPPQGPGVQWNLLVDTVATRCATVEEAVSTLTGVTHLRSITYLLADPRTAAAVEATPRGVTVRAQEKGIVIATNHALGHRDGTDRTRHSLARYGRAHDRLSEAAPNVTAEDAIGVLRDPVCTIREGKRFLHELDHVPLAAEENWGTIWSTVCRPASKDMRVAPGHPDDEPYAPVAWPG